MPTVDEDGELYGVGGRSHERVQSGRTVRPEKERLDEDDDASSTLPPARRSRPVWGYAAAGRPVHRGVERPDGRRYCDLANQDRQPFGERDTPRECQQNEIPPPWWLEDLWDPGERALHVAPRDLGAPADACEGRGVGSSHRCPYRHRTGLKGAVRESHGVRRRLHGSSSDPRTATD